MQPLLGLCWPNWAFCCQSLSWSLPVASQSCRLCGCGLHLSLVPLGLLVFHDLSLSPLCSAFSEASAWYQSQSRPTQHPHCSLSFFWTLGTPKVLFALRAHLQVSDCPCSLDVFSSHIPRRRSILLHGISHCMVHAPYLACLSVPHAITSNSQASVKSMGERWSMLKDITAILPLR